MAPHGVSSSRNNIFEDVDHVEWGGTGRFLQLLNVCENVTVDHNTILQSGALISFATAPSTGFVYKNNISPVGSGVCGNTSCGSTALASWAPASVVTRNVIAGAPAPSYPAANFYPSSVYDARFVDMFASNYALAASSPYRSLGTDGKNLGADFAAVTLATTGVVR